MVVDHLNWRLRTHIKLDAAQHIASSSSSSAAASGTGSASGADREKPVRRTLSTSVGDED